MRKTHPQGIVRLSNAADYRLFGAKASNLAKCIKAGIRTVPPALVLSHKILKALADAGTFAPGHHRMLEDFLSKLHVRVAVRSSEIVPSSKAALVSGVFRTERHVYPELDAVRAAIEEVQRHSRAIRWRGEGTTDLALPVIVQAEVKSLLSGVAETRSAARQDCWDVWFVDGDLAPLVSGKAAGHLTRIPHVEKRRPTEVWCSTEAFETATRIGFWQIAGTLSTMAVRCERALRSPALIEWSYDGSRLHLLQAQPIMR